jgi:hypothetical protein
MTNINVNLRKNYFQDIVAAIDRDASNTYLDAICSHSDSYNVGKAIGMVARLASISREFNTNHYTKLDTSIKSCLEKWLRVQGQNQFRNFPYCYVFTYIITFKLMFTFIFIV